MIIVPNFLSILTHILEPLWFHKKVFCRAIYQRYLLETVFIGPHGDIIARFGGRYRELSRTGVEIALLNRGAMGYESQHRITERDVHAGR